MKKYIIIPIFCFATVIALAQNSYGSHIYPHPGSECSSGSQAVINPGFILGGYNATVAVGRPNFHIDRTDMGGVFNGAPYEFQQEYYTYGTYTCTNWNLNQITDCAGISVIDDPNSGDYLAFGACHYCAYYANIATNGFVNFGIAYKFRNFASRVAKPIVARSNVHNGEYYFSGTYDDTMYVFRIDLMGTIQASYAFYLASGSIDPKGIVESPYGNNDLVIVGGINHGTSSEAFYFQIDNNLTTPVSMIAYVLGSGGTVYSTFLSITTADPGNANAGFLIGGNSDIQGFGQAWMLKLDASGNVLWNKIITGNLAVMNYSVMGVAERYSAANNMYEAYGAASSTLGIMVYKLDDNGGIPVSMVNGNPDEFQYNDGSVTFTRPVNISYYNNGAAFDEGLHMYGNAENVPGEHYLVQAYFSGESGCQNRISNIASANTHTIWGHYPTSYTVPPPTTCNFTVTSSPIHSYSTACIAQPSLPPPASNSRHTSVRDLTVTDNALVFPNPASDFYVIDTEGVESSSVEVFDVLGNRMEIAVSETDGGKLTIRPENWNSGIYYLTIKKQGMSKTIKLVYSRE